MLQIKERTRCVGREPRKLLVAHGEGGYALIAENEELGEKLAEPLILSVGKPRDELARFIGTLKQSVERIEQYQKLEFKKLYRDFAISHP